MGHFSRDAAIGVAATAFAVGAMAYDHLVPGDAAGFVVGTAASVALAAALFGWLVPRHGSDPQRAATTGVVCSVLAIVPGIALGLAGRRGERRRRASTAVVLGAAVLVLGAVAYAVGGSDVTG